ncbi:MAG: gamma-glutamylcyclotransferase family protein [Blastomonas sp.]
MNIFFYGLFMDRAVLAEKGIVPSSIVTGHVDGFAIRIGARATLRPCPGARAYGVMMDIAAVDAERLYADPGVADYLPECVAVILSDGSVAEALCYNLPADKVAGTNRDYARALASLAASLGFPRTYLDEIGHAGGGA